LTNLQNIPFSMITSYMSKEGKFDFSVYDPFNMSHLFLTLICQFIYYTSDVCPCLIYGPR